MNDPMRGGLLTGAAIVTVQVFSELQPPLLSFAFAIKRCWPGANPDVPTVQVQLPPLTPLEFFPNNAHAPPMSCQNSTYAIVPSVSVTVCAVSVNGAPCTTEEDEGKSDAMVGSAFASNAMSSTSTSELGGRFKASTVSRSTLPIGRSYGTYSDSQNAPSSNAVDPSIVEPHLKRTLPPSVSPLAEPYTNRTPVICPVGADQLCVRSFPVVLNLTPDLVSPSFCRICPAPPPP